MVNPFPPVFAVNAPHGLIDALDAHTCKHRPALLPLNSGHASAAARCASDRAGGSSSGPPHTALRSQLGSHSLSRMRTGSRSARADDLHFHSRYRAHRLRLLTPVDAPAPMLGFGLVIWLPPAAGVGARRARRSGSASARRCCWSPEGISDGTARRSRGTPPVVWRKGGPETGRSRSLSGTATL
ncbi:hypothetical protein DFH07DRAFT_970861 [Mycena maculata]|uniref:Uncharacterized protein n=1 Tax=Mycena maculata TaxID=230809 RepID=A0AAD7HR23_9AGAR|nr:hypothetical protein DFH07DRAFT_970861 [Mycena maculata]